MVKNKSLFSDFPKPGKNDWEARIKEDLRTAPYDKLITPTLEGIDIKPYYHRDDLKELEYLDSLPGEFPYTRSTETGSGDWEIREDIIVFDAADANTKALRALHRGATALTFMFPDEVEIDQGSFNTLMKGIYFDCIDISYRTINQADKILEFLLALSEEKNIDPSRLRGSLNSDPLAYLTTTGNIFPSAEGALDGLSKRMAGFREELKTMDLLTINADIFHRAGGSVIQELGFGISLLVEYLHALTGRGLSIDEIAANIRMNFSVGPLYFMEIAKFRAARMLFASLIRSYKPDNPDSEKLFIHAKTSEWNQSIYDRYVNMLRGTTESMSAVIGNVDSLSVTPFDKAFRETTIFSKRIARNVQIILKEEAHLSRIIDPSAGSYYIESLTDQVAERSWQLFLEIEEHGGYLAALTKGIIQEMIGKTADKRDDNIACRKEILLGTNQYAIPEEKIPEDMVSEPVQAIKTGETLIKPIVEYRGAESFEKLRMNTERSGKEPLVFLLTTGNLNWRMARAGFASGFFACGGYRIRDNHGFDTVSQGMRAAEEAGADIIVLCSSDDEYPGIAPEAVKECPEGRILVLAGYPKDSVDDLKSIGIEHFIHTGSNLLEDLKKYNSLLGINGN